jgi:hypothetical protein
MQLSLGGPSFRRRVPGSMWLLRHRYATDDPRARRALTSGGIRSHHLSITHSPQHRPREDNCASSIYVLTSPARLGECQ